MATAISRYVLNRETNTRFWSQSRYKIGKPLDPKNPLDAAKMPLWMDIFRTVQAEAAAGTLVTTYDNPVIVQALEDAKLASEGAAQNGLNVRPEDDPWDFSSLVTEPRPAGPPTQPAEPSGPSSMLRPEDDPWDSRYVPPPRELPPAGPSPRPAGPPARPSMSPRERPSQAVINRETNFRFWIRTKYKPHAKLDMSIPADREMAETWKQIQREVEREANAGRLTLTNPELIPPPEAPTSGPPAPPPRPSPPRPSPQRPSPPPPRPPPPRPAPPPGPSPTQRPSPSPAPPMQPAPSRPAPSRPPSWEPSSPSPPPWQPQPLPPTRPAPMPDPQNQRPGPRPGSVVTPPGWPGPQPSPSPRPSPLPGQAPMPGPAPYVPVFDTPQPPPSVPPMRPAPTGEALPTGDPGGPTTEGAPAESPSSIGKWIALSLLGLVVVGGGYAIGRSQRAPQRRSRAARRFEPDASAISSFSPRFRGRS